MRTSIAVLLVLLFCGKAFSVADLAPIVDSQTIAVVRVDLKQVETEKILKFLADEIKDIVPQVVPGQAEAGQAILAAQGGLTAAAMYVQPILKTLQNEGKTDEIFFIVDKKAIGEGMYPFFGTVLKLNRQTGI